MGSNGAGDSAVMTMAHRLRPPAEPYRSMVVADAARRVCAIKKRGGLQPFRELGRMGAVPLAQAVETSAGRLPFKSIIHVAGINMLWRSSESSVRDSVRNAIAIAHDRGYQSIAMPLIGAGSGRGKAGPVASALDDRVRELESENLKQSCGELNASETF